MDKGFKIFLIIGAVIILLAAGWFFYHKNIKPAIIEKGMPDLGEEIKITAEMDDARKEQLINEINQTREDLKANSDSLQDWLQYGILLKSVGDYEGARDAWEYASSIRPQNSISFHNLGDLYHHNLKDYKKSEENYLMALENKPAQTFTCQNLYELYRYSYEEKNDMADDILLKCLESNPEEVYFMILLGSYYEDTGNISGAIFYYEQALEIDPANETLKQDIENLKNKSL